MKKTRHPPAMHKLLDAPCFAQGYSKAALKVLANALLEAYRNHTYCPESLEEWLSSLKQRYDALLTPPFIKIYNATGVLLSTNLGRAPLDTGALRELEILGGYVDLELDLKSAKRFDRCYQLQELLKTLFNAPDALVLNNNASALVLVASVFAPKDAGKQTLLSYGQLVEIGGGFRAHELLESVTHLKLVGSTNKTYLSDYQKAFGESSALVASIHPSNFSMSGFVASVSSKALFKLAQEKGVPFYEDLGSMQNLESVQKALKSAHVLSFSADKLFGSVQGGIVLGAKTQIEKMRQHPLYRAFRVDKISLFMLTKDLQAYLQNQKNPTQIFLKQDKDALLNKTLKLHRALSAVAGLQCFVIPTQALVGGGVDAGMPLESFGVQLQIKHPSLESFYLSLCQRGLVGVMRHNGIILDVYALFEKDLAIIAKIVQEATLC